jgi:hypothetical protein
VAASKEDTVLVSHRQPVVLRAVERNTGKHFGTNPVGNGKNIENGL